MRQNNQTSDIIHQKSSISIVLEFVRYAIKQVTSTLEMTLGIFNMFNQFHMFKIEYHAVGEI